jgi:hypothetical protein
MHTTPYMVLARSQRILENLSKQVKKSMNSPARATRTDLLLPPWSNTLVYYIYTGLLPATHGTVRV